MIIHNYEDFIQNINDGIYFVDKKRKITYWNKAAEKITGYSSNDVVGSHCFDNILVHLDDAGNSLCHTRCPLAATMNDGIPRDAEIYLHHKKGHRLPVSVRVIPLRNKTGKIIGGIEFFSDLSLKEVTRQRLEELEKLAFLDNLTKLANRRYLELTLDSHFSEIKRYGTMFGILFMDIDHFKTINDTYGHDVGDLVLKTLAQTLMSTARPFDIFGRWGGEEFLGIIRHADISVLIKIGSRIRALVEKSSVEWNGSRLNVTISIGATMVSTEDTVQDALKRADVFLYKSKASGRNRLTSDLDS